MGKKILKYKWFIAFFVILIIASLVVSDFNNNVAFDDTVSFINCKDGYCLIIKSKDTAAIIDFGSAKYSSSHILRQAKKLKIHDFKYGFITNTSSYHIGGYFSVAYHYTIKNIICPKFSDFDYDEIITKTVKNSLMDNKNVGFATSGNVYKVGNFDIKIVYYNNSELKYNNRSVILMISAFGKNILYTSNMEMPLTFRLKALNLKADIVTVPTQCEGFIDYDFFKSLKPKYAIASADKNDYSVEDSEYFEQKTGIKTLSTFNEGDIIFSFSKDGFKNITNEVQYVNN